MEAERFDRLSRALATDTISRRATLKALALGGVASLFGRFTADADASSCGGKCAKRNWCENRTHTCGTNGKCFVKRFGGQNICAGILFQATSCLDCKEPNCVGCTCILAAGGGDKCNNGVNGDDYICVREI